MFYFVNFDNPSKSESYDKGILFEKLCKILLDSCGYKDIDMRVKANNLEYDIQAVNKATLQSLIGEAKAWDKKISSEIMAFVGKMIHHWIKDKEMWGIFISVSELTSDVKQQIDDMIKENYHIRYIVGEDILKVLVEQKEYASINQIKQFAEKTSEMNSSDTYFLVSDRGNYYIQLLIEKGHTLPTFFICYDCYGNIIKDTNFTSMLKAKVSIVKELKAFEDVEILNKNDYNEQIQAVGQESSFLGVIHGEGWFDYQFPANPDKFIGRSNIISVYNSLIKDIINNNTKTKVIEVLSRSGVGKSSIALKLQKSYKVDKFPNVIVDSRNIRSDIDTLQIFQNLVFEYNLLYNCKLKVPQSKKEIFEICREIDITLINEKKLAIIFLDQFESVFARPQIYNSLIDIILEFNMNFNAFAFTIARKNDQPTTYDESSEIDLNRLKGISKPLVLQDFKIEEALELIGHINDEIGVTLIKPLKEQVLEISNGFPWLLKKYCAHIIKLVKNGSKQKSIAQKGMQLEDLFNEDILALDETIREFFYRLINFLPATYSELAEAFSESDLAVKLRILQNDYRLIRLTGRTYDTYNDILKEFVKTGHVNLTQRYLIRYNPNSIIKLFKQIADKGWISIDQVVENSKDTQGSIENKLGELRKLKLLDGNNNNFFVVQTAMKAYEDEQILKYISSILMNNSIVKIIIEKLNMNSKLSIEDVMEILKIEMPFIEASETIWKSYSKIMCKWIQSVHLADLNNEYLLRANSDNSSIFLETNNVFFPTVMISQIEKILFILSSSEDGMTIQDLKKQMKRSSLNGHLADALFLEFVSAISRSEYQITEKGKGYLNSSIEERKRLIREKTHDFAHIIRYKILLQEYEDSIKAFSQLLNELNIDRWNEESIKWKHKILRNWLIFSNEISKKRGKRKKQVESNLLIKST